MGLETATYINGLVTTNPTSSDPKSQGDDHLRLVKSTVKATFPNITGAVTPTHGDLNVLAGAATGGVAMTLSSLNTGQLAGLRNRIINGDFRIHQRGVAASGGQYPADRTYVNYSGANCSAITTTGQVFGNYKSANAIVITGAAGNTGNGFVQIIESTNCRDMAGQVVTLSYWIYQDTGASYTANPVIYYTGTVDGGVASGITDARVAAAASVSCASGVWTYCTFTTTLVAAATTGFALSIGMPATVAGKTAKIANLQLEVGSVATPFEQRPYGMELALCQRYFERMTYSSTQVGPSGGYAQNSTVCYMSFPISPKRTSATAVFSGAGTAQAFYSGGTTTNITMSTVYGRADRAGQTCQFTTAAVLTTNQTVQFYASGGDVNVDFSAEL